MAAYEGFHRVVEALLGYGANIEAEYGTGRTALHRAARRKNEIYY